MAFICFVEIEVKVNVELKDNTEIKNE